MSLSTDKKPGTALREYLRVALEAQNYEVLTAAHGQEALAYLGAHRVDAVRKRFPGVRWRASSA
jgi:ribosomal protein S12